MSPRSLAWSTTSRARLPAVQGLLVGHVLAESQRRGARHGGACAGDSGGAGAQDAAGNSINCIDLGFSILDSGILVHYSLLTYCSLR